MRLDLNKASVETIYVTIWASPSVSLHLGKTENADEIWSKHAGVRLQVEQLSLKKDSVCLCYYPHNIIIIVCCQFK